MYNTQQIKDITVQVAKDLEKYSFECAEVLVNCHLENDNEVLLLSIGDWIKSAEDEVIKQINSDLIEDSFDNFYPSYDL
jgi:predicted small metal-binding protein